LKIRSILVSIFFSLNNFKEMDLLIGGFANNNLQSLTSEELKEFEILLNFTDKELSSWLVDNKKNIEIEKFSISQKIKEFKLKF